MSFLDKLGERRFRGLLRAVERRAATPERSRALARAGLARLDGEGRLAVLGKALAQAVADAPEAQRAVVLERLLESGSAKLSGDARRALPGRLLQRLAAEQRPPFYLSALCASVASGLEPLEPQIRQTADAQLIAMLAIDRALEQADLAEVLAPGDHPILLGPWTMEVGFELLYWIPLLRRYLREAGVDPSRVVAISRGGVEGWYGDLAGRYVDLFDYLTPAEFKALGEAIEAEHGSKKPFTPTRVERELVERIVGDLGLAGHRTIFPSALYGLFRTTWLRRFGGETFLPALEFAPMAGDWARPQGLPFDGPYVAVKFYESEFFEGPQVTPFVRGLLTRLARHHRVVLLNTGLTVDDHSDVASLLPEVAPERLFDAAPLMAARANLAVQSALVANAEALYCTFGGFSYLGPLLGVDTFSFFTHTHFVSSHLDLALRAFNREGYGSLAFLPVSGMGEAALATLAGAGPEAA